MNIYLSIIFYTILTLPILINLHAFSQEYKSNNTKSNLIAQDRFSNFNQSSFSKNRGAGTIVVKTMVKNGPEGQNKSNDFIINIHANDPSKTTFNGNSSGTSIKVGMGMYSIKETPIKGYNTTFSSDCFGGIMTTETKKCIITNTYVPLNSTSIKWTRLLQENVNITIVYFAQVRESIGIKEEKINIPSKTSINNLLGEITRRHPEIKNLLNVIQISINYKITHKNTILKEGDEVAILPPVTGG